MILQDGNIRIRPVQLPDDIPLTVPWYQDPEVLYYSEGGDSTTPYDAERVEKMYKYLLNKGEVYIIEKEDGGVWSAIGDAALCADCLPIVIGEGKFRSQGIGKRVLKLLVERAQSIEKQKLIVNGVYTFNERSRRMYESAGFKPIETYVDDDGNEATRLELLLPVIRNATEADLPAVSKLSALWEAENNTYGLAANTIEWLQPRLGDYFYTAQLGAEIVGYIFGTVHESEGTAVIGKGETYIEIEEIYVRPEFRNSNIGHRMVDKLLDGAEANGITRSVVYSAAKQWQTIVGFYEKHGFKMWYVQMYK